MNRIILSLVISLCCLGPPVTADGQTPRPDPSEMLRQLLAIPAPRPPGATETTEPTKLRPDDFFARDKAPPDDAPIDDLIDYWTRWIHHPTARPSDAVKQRLLEACLAKPEIMVELINLLPQTAASATKIKEVYDKAESHQELDQLARERIKNWLLLNSNFFLNELFALASKVKDDENGGYIERKEAIVGLANVNWELAEPLLRSLTTSAQPRSAALAHSLYYEHAIKEKDSAAEERYRNNLKAIASNRTLPAYARDIAIETLSSTEWSGRDEWYLGLFQDETLLDLTDGSRAFSALTTVFYSDPDKWIPIMARLVESKDLTVRSAAARCLITFQNQSARRDALLPLLPWLSNPTWVKDIFGNRLRLIQSMSFLDMPESVPGLIWVVENDAYYGDRSYAAQSLAKYKDPRAAPALKKALAKETDEYHRKMIIEGLIACQGLTDAEQLEALEAYAAKLITTEGREDLKRYRNSGEEPLPVSISTGKYLGELLVASDSLVHAVLTRAENLKSDNLPLAKSLLEIAHRWQGRQVDLDVITRIGNGSADATTINAALKRRVTLRQDLGPELHALTAVSGTAQGIGALLLDEPSLTHGVLNSEDQFAQIALLACSRLTHTSLPVALVGPLLRSKNNLLALAAERYLLIEDSKGARELLWQRHPNKAFVTGWGENSELIYGNFDLVSKTEEKLRAELFKENGPLEIIALVVDSEHHSRVLRIFSDKAVYTQHEDRARYRERIVSKAELSSFKQFLTTKGLPDLGPQFGWCHHNCTSEEFLTLTKEKGRRVYTEQPYQVWNSIRENFDLLGRGEGARTHYNLEKEIKGLQVLYTDERLAVKDVWQQGSDIRILVEREQTEEAELDDSDSDDDSEAASLDSWRREIARRKARFSWRVYANNKAGGVTSQPEIYSTIDESKFPPDDYVGSVLDYERQVQKLTADSVIIARNMDGLWKQFAGTKAVRVGGENGGYSSPIATPNGKWVVVSRGDSDWSKPYIVRFNLRTGREYRVNLEPAGQFHAIAFVPSHGKVLLRRAKDNDGSATTSVGPDRPEYYLLDPATGDTRLVSGKFAPLHQPGQRFLQSTEKPNEFWAAIPDSDKHQTQIGRYNLKDFTFKPVLLVPHIIFNSMSMWVDESQQKLYLVYEGQLLRLPLQ